MLKKQCECVDGYPNTNMHDANGVCQQTEYLKEYMRNGHKITLCCNCHFSDDELINEEDIL